MTNVPDKDELAESSYFDENAREFLPREPQGPALASSSVKEQIRQRAFELGFVRTGFARVEPFDEAGAAFRQWFNQGYGGDMSYLGDLGDRSDPRRLLPNARTMVVVAMPTVGPIFGEPSPGEGTVADYALGLDYHIAIRGRLERLSEFMADVTGQAHRARPCVDTAPLLEREAARRAGIGFIGKSTMLIVPGLGPRVLLGVVITTLDLEVDPPCAGPRCGSCTACLKACPTAAFVGPYRLDARRCVSYLTIEHQGEVERALRSKIGNRLVGCDECQTACPYDRVEEAAVMPVDASPRPRLVHPQLVRWLQMTSTDYRRITRRTALRRLGRVQLMRNAAIALGNSRDDTQAEPLAHALLTSNSPIVRAHAAWALGQLSSSQARELLAQALETEADPSVRVELEAALTNRDVP